MITATDIARLQDEILLRDVRRVLDAEQQKKTFRQQAWTWLNSSFVLWFLSSVVIAALSSSYTIYNARRAEQSRRTDARRRVCIEITSRIDEALTALDLDVLRVSHGQYYPPAAIFTEASSYLTLYFASETDRSTFGVYPEFRQRSFPSLLFELRSLALLRQVTWTLPRFSARGR